MNTPTIFSYCSTNNMNGLTEMIENRGIEIVNVRGCCLNTPLHFAARYNSIECLQLLLKSGADVNAGNDTGKTPLHIASMFNSKECIKALIESGANLNQKDDHRATSPLHIAATNNYAECLQYLLENGADLNTKDFRGFTPLHLAAANNSIECIKLLLEFGAIINIKDEDYERTPLHLAAIRRELSCVLLLLLLENGADVNATDERMHTPLHLTTARNFVEHMKILIENGADVNAKNRYGKTFLDMIKDDITKAKMKKYVEDLSTLDIKEPSC